MNRNQLKCFAVLAMLLDHIAVAFLEPASAAYFVMRFIGRITGPVMAFFVAEGYQHTGNLKKYALRLGLFALIAWIPFSIFEIGMPPIWFFPGKLSQSAGLNIYLPTWNKTLFVYPRFSVFHTLFLGLMAVWLWDLGRCTQWCKIAGVGGLCILAVFGDWSYYNVLFILVLFCCRDRPKEKWLLFYMLSAVMILFNVSSWEDWYRLGILTVPFLIQFCYNGEPGKKTGVYKWGFYVFYPAHLLILGLIKAAL